MSKFSFAATGDSFIVRRIPGLNTQYKELVSLIQEADVRFTNLETVLRRHDEGFPSAQSGGTWASSPPEVLEDLKEYGFNLIAWANNHTLDYSYGGLASTAKYLNQYGFTHAGVGHTLAEANAIRYLDLPGGRVAFIAATASFHPSWIAGEQRTDGPGRPGVNPVRHQVFNHVSPEQLQALREIAETSGINREQELRIQEGFALPEKEGRFRFGEHLFVADGRQSRSTRVHPGDLVRIQQSIREASRMADIVLVSIHAHESEPGKKDHPAEFLVEFSRSCIDAGADAIIGHGPHILRGIEVYQGRPIFYSLGDFVFHNESVQWLPADFYEKYALDPSKKVSELFHFRSGEGKSGLRVNPKVWHSVIAKWKMDHGKLTEIRLHPISLGFGLPVHQMGNPQLTDNQEALHEICELSQPLGTEFSLEQGIAVWRS